MARRTIVQFIDDLDGSSSEDVTTVSFGLEGVEYEIDLNEANATRLRDGLAEFVGAAKRTGGRVKRGSTPKTGRGPARSKDETKAIREWARANGHDLAERGRIPSNVREAYEAAQSA